MRFHRRRAGLSQIELARLADVGKATVYEVEKGKASVRVDSLIKVLLALNIKVDLTGPLMSEANADTANGAKMRPGGNEP